VTLIDATEFSRSSGRIARASAGWRPERLDRDGTGALPIAKTVRVQKKRLQLAHVARVGTPFISYPKRGVMSLRPARATGLAGFWTPSVL